MIPFNKPLMFDESLAYLAQAAASGQTSGNGPFTRGCQRFFEERYGFSKCLLTTSCTGALEMAAILSDIQPGDEVIMPSFTFVSTALAFIRQGATIVFADSCRDQPNLDAGLIEPLITPRTRVIVPVHYAGVACDMDRILALAARYGLLVVSDAAQAIESRFAADLRFAKPPRQNRGQASDGGYFLGGLGHLGCFSFHETKNIHCGEGGLLAINDSRFIRRAELVWEKGTNRAEYGRGSVSKYEWLDVGSSFLPSDLTAAFLWGQLGHLDAVQDKRRSLWNLYFAGLAPLAGQGRLALPELPDYATNNAHMFYLICSSEDERCQLMAFLDAHGIAAATHFRALHEAPFFRGRYAGLRLANCTRFVECLLRLPLYYELEPAQVDFIVSKVRAFYEDRKAALE